MKLAMFSGSVLSWGSQHNAKAAEEKRDNPISERIFTASADLPRMEKWLVDSGASSHMTHQKEFLLDYRQFAEKVGVSDGLELSGSETYD